MGPDNVPMDAEASVDDTFLANALKMICPSPKGVVQDSVVTSAGSLDSDDEETQSDEKSQGICMRQSSRECSLHADCTVVVTHTYNTHTHTQITTNPEPTIPNRAKT